MTTLVPLIETTRGGTPECQHFGAIAVADRQGRLVAHAGPAHWLTYTRSTLKAFQALPFVQAGGPAHFGFSQRQLAMMCASHSGEPMHVQEVQGMLDKAGLDYRRLQCGCHVPIFVELGVAPRPESHDERHHNCSGKHAGFLAWCVQHGAPLDSYLDPGHPLQQAIRREVARAAGVSPDEMKMGIDGCSAPNYAMPTWPAATRGLPAGPRTRSSATASPSSRRRCRPIPSWSRARAETTRRSCVQAAAIGSPRLALTGCRRWAVAAGAKPWRSRSRMAIRQRSMPPPWQRWINWGGSTMNSARRCVPGGPRRSTACAGRPWASATPCSR